MIYKLKGKQSKLDSGQYNQQAIYKGDIIYEHKRKCANAITNKQYDYGVRSPRPTSPLLTSRRSPLSQPGFLRLPDQRLHLTIQFSSLPKTLQLTHSCNPTLHPLKC